MEKVANRRLRALASFFKLDWRSMVWSWWPRSKKEQGDAIVVNFLLHWFPNRVSHRSLSWSYSLWLGTISAVLFLILTVTGVILMFFYVPSTERAYASIKDLEYVIPYGSYLRNLHRISAHLMVGVVFLHMMRVFLTAAYRNGVFARQNRPLNWLIGIVLLLATLLLSFTGYLLPWDQLAFWAITVGTEIARNAPLVGEQIRFVLLGGNEISQNTLIRFYTLHVFFLPALVLLLFCWHMWRIRKDGGLACEDHLALEEKKKQVKPSQRKNYMIMGLVKGETPMVKQVVVDTEEQTVHAVPILVRRVLLVGLATLAVAMLLTQIIPAPLEDPANPSVTPNPAKAPWYFLWLQELVTITTIKFGNGFAISGGLIGGILIPGILVLWAAVWPWLDRSPVEAVGVWFHKKRFWQNLVFILISLFIVALILVASYMRGPFWEWYWPWQTWEAPPVKY